VTRHVDPERTYLARRAATLSRLTSSGMPQERAEALVAAWEAEAGARGLERHSAASLEPSDKQIAEPRRRRT
jgi:hypothetical protein